MPSVGMPHSTTRIFLPKSVAKDGNLGRGNEDGNVGRVLRSGKRLYLESNHEKHNRGSQVEHFHVPSCYKSNTWRMGIPQQEDINMDVNIVSPPESVDEVFGSDESRYKNVYDRKRRRSFDLKKEDRMLGTFYVRKKLRKTSASSPLVDDVDCYEVIENSDSRMLIPGTTLDVSVDSSPSSSLRFTCFFVSVMKFARTSSLITLPGLAAFMCCEPIVSAFSRQGVHFKLGLSPATSLSTDTISSGFCRIFGDQTFVPLFWLDFLAAPLSFWNLHSIVFFRSLYLPNILPGYLIGLLNKTNGVIDECNSLSCLPTETSLPQNNNIDSRNTDAKEIDMNFVVGGSGLDGRRAWTKHAVSQHTKRKRSSLRSKRGKNTLSVGFQGIQNLNSNNQSRINGFGKKRRGNLGLDIFEGRDGAFQSLATPRSNEKQTNPVQMDFCYNSKQVKSTLDALRNDVESVRCNANVLFIESDRCFREEGATIMLECSTSKVWHVVVKARGFTKYTQQTHEVMRPNMTNRFTHALIWTAEDGWKLEFCDRIDWLVFKELHKVCLSKNLGDNYKTIPVPGVREVLNYDSEEYVMFSRPEYYITVHTNEVARALAKKTASYDIEPDDEEWLEKLNSDLYNGDDGVFEQLSAEKFEEIIDILEKAAYRCPSDVSNESKLTSLCSGSGRGDIIAAVYQYWLTKRKQNLAALLRVFKCQPPRNAQVAQDNVLRKKRSFKKQTSQNGRDKQQYYIEAMSAEQELAMKRVEEAQLKAKESLESAVAKRKRAQTLMQNADLAAYMAALAVNIAETVQLAESASASASASASGQRDDG